MSDYTKKKDKIKIAAVGDNCMDVYDAENKGFPGGNPVNVAVYAVRLGYEASYMGAVGTDQYGIQMVDSIKKMGVDTSHIKVVEGSTAVTHVELRDGDRILGHYEEGVMSNFYLNDEDILFLSEHDIVITGIWGKIENELSYIKEKGVPIAFDFATKLDEEMTEEVYEIVKKALPYTDYAFYSSDKSTEELKEHMKSIYERGPKIVIVTRGEKGSIAFDGETFTESGIVKCKVVDTLGAGDSYIAGFLIGLLEGRHLKECMEYGAENSSITIQYFGAWNV